ncbi:M20/M25/M40 family metallo-hydrolase [Lentzea sp. JNUCC 0626]|uniref:M20/M25/M40 family metallo-hydrolase n=1 Tax=Lentzea sp. JNUCC 0626 TaxID=3367513 RepID=UPI003748D1ED
MRLPIALTSVVATAAALVAVAGSGAAADGPVVTYEDVLPHLQKFQSIADQHGGNRAHGTPGFKASLDHVKSTLDTAGFVTRVDSFEQDGAPGYNLVADWPGGDENHVVMLGAHLDSVPDGPGMNDNASGSAGVLATALTVAKERPQTGRHVRFAWWGAEETGLNGSRHYVDGSSAADLAKIDVYLNFDMAATRDEDQYFNLDAGSAEATEAFRTYLGEHGKQTFEVGGGEGSDNWPFQQKGVPVGGFATGLDACYHKACDNLANIDPAVQTLSTNAMINALWQLKNLPAQDMSGVGDPYFPKDGNAGYDVEHYDVKLRYDPAKPDLLTGDATITATATQDLSLFHLDLLGFDVVESTVEGKPVVTRREDEHELVLTPQDIVRKGQKFVTRIRYQGKPAGAGWHPIEGGGFAAYGEPHSATSWFPANDHPGDKATFALTATVPDGWSVMGNGVPGETTKADGHSTFRWHEDKPMETTLATVAVDRFTIHERTAAGVPAYFGYGSGVTVLPESEELLDPMLTFFSELYGPYPFSSTGAIVVRAKTGHPAIETQSRPTFNGMMFDANMAHEFTHQWFGNSVSIADWRNACIKECVAQYANQLWDEHNGADLDKGFYPAMYEESHGKPEFWATRLYDPGPGKELDPALYSKGSMMMHALRKAMGDDNFFTLLRTWMQDHRYGNATWPQFEELAQRTAGKDLSGFFQAWAHSTTEPEEKYLFPAGR